MGFVSSLKPAECFTRGLGWLLTEPETKETDSILNTICVFLDKKLKILSEMLPLYKYSQRIHCLEAISMV